MKTKTIVIMFIATAFGILAVSLSLSRCSDGPAAMDKELVKVSSDMNKTLPMMLDKDTRLDTTVPGPGKRLTYVNTIVNYELAQIDTVAMRKILTPNILSNYKTQKDMESFRKQGVVLRYQYKDKNGVYLIEIEANPMDF